MRSRERRVPARRSSPRLSDSSWARAGTRPSSERAARRPTSRPSSTCPTACSTKRGSKRWRSCGRRTRKASSSPGGCSPTGARAHMHGAVRRPATTWQQRPSACWRCRGSSSKGGSRGPPTSSTCSTRSAARDSCGAASPREALGAERERLRHVTELAAGAGAAGDALAPDDGEGAASLVALAERAISPLEVLAPELQRAGDELRDAELRLRETATELRSFLASLEAEPDRLEQVEAELDRIAEAKRRFRCNSYEELLARAGEAQAELDALEDGADPVAAAAKAVAAAERHVDELATAMHEARLAASEPFATAVAAELEGIGMGEGEFRVELSP